jgi:hypothetical protein
VAILMGSSSVGTIATVVFPVPAGLCNVTFYNLSANNVWIGTSTAVTSSNGMQCHSIPTNFYTYVGSRGTQIYAIGTAGTSYVQYLISTDA